MCKPLEICDSKTNGMNIMAGAKLFRNGVESLALILLLLKIEYELVGHSMKLLNSDLEQKHVDYTS